jgi:MEDS: MEthanogen/methylotroph, DcmR Sensory domain
MEPFRHEALLYEGETEFVDQLSAFIRDGVAAGEPTLVVVGERKLDLLRQELGDVGDTVQLADMTAVGRNPARIIPAWQSFVGRHAEPGVRLRGIGEPIYPERHAAELVECQRHESLLNVAFADASSFWLVCPYDITTLPDDVIEEAWRSHPLIAAGARREDSRTTTGSRRSRHPLPPRFRRLRAKPTISNSMPRTVSRRSAASPPSRRPRPASASGTASTSSSLPARSRERASTSATGKARPRSGVSESGSVVRFAAATSSPIRSVTGSLPLTVLATTSGSGQRTSSATSSRSGRAPTARSCGSTCLAANRSAQARTGASRTLIAARSECCSGRVHRQCACTRRARDRAKRTRTASVDRYAGDRRRRHAPEPRRRDRPVSCRLRGLAGVCSRVPQGLIARRSIRRCRSAARRRCRRS